ncbi:MAG: ubiquinol oxidase subunit II [Gammaproteobacteria bacterium RIFCSPHIGHO2_12_FULL_42_13]|nr:MAG: ubiquinol oxidase subunit II [Gammaproteobacteria bacterium RIFCSPHIGHO2_12_FULL_42_13]
MRCFFRAFLLVCLALPLISCHFAILDPKGVIAETEKHVFLESVFLMLIVVIPVIILSFIVPWRYRAKNTKAVYKPEWSNSHLLEFIWWAIPCVIIAVLATITWIETHRLDPYRPLYNNPAPDAAVIPIEAIALNWKWLFIYPQEHVASLNTLTIPVNHPIRFYITSDGPMNSLEIPQLAGQIYAMGGMQTKLNLLATEQGIYRGLSTNLSGDGFSGMYFNVNVVSDKDYAQWVRALKQAPKHLSEKTYQALLVPSANNPPEYFSQVSDDFFSEMVIKYMGPMPGMVLGYRGDPNFTSSSKNTGN